MSEPIWKTKSGEVLRLSQMTDEHLINAMAFMSRKTSIICLSNLKNLSAIGVKPSDLLPDIYYDMAKELKKRKTQHKKLGPTDKRILEL